MLVLAMTDGGGGDQLGQMMRQAMVTVAVLELHEGESLT